VRGGLSTSGRWSKRRQKSGAADRGKQSKSFSQKRGESLPPKGTGKKRYNSKKRRVIWVVGGSSAEKGISGHIERFHTETGETTQKKRKE